MNSEKEQPEGVQPHTIEEQEPAAETGGTPAEPTVEGAGQGAPAPESQTPAETGGTPEGKTDS